MADRDVTVDILARDKTSPAISGAAGKFDGLDRSAKRMESSISGSMRKAETSLRKLQDRFERGAETSGGSTRIGQAIVKSISSAAGKMAGVGASLMGSLASGLDAAGPQVKAVIVAAVVGAAIAASTVAGAAIAGGITAALGGGVLALGIKSGLSDPRVQQAFAPLQENLKRVAADFGEPFRAPLVAAAGDFQAALKRVEPTLARIARSIAPSIGPLVEGLIGLVERALPGIERAVAAAGPLIDKLSAKLPDIGEKTGTAFEEMAKGAEGGGEALSDLIDVCLAFVVANAQVIGALGRTYGQLKRGVNFLTDMVGLTDNASKGMTVMGGAIGKANTELGRFTFTTAEAADAVNRILSPMLELDNANLNFERSLRQVSETFKENGRQIDIATEKGQNNRQAILDTIGVLQRQYNANIAAGMSSTEAATAYDKGTAALERQLRKAGLNTAQIEQLIGKYKGVPGEVETDIALNGLAAVLKGLTDTLREIHGLDGETATVHVRYRVQGQPIAVQGISDYMRGASGTDTWQARQYAAGLGQPDFAGGGETMRAGGPTEVKNNVQVSVDLDGRPFREMTARAVATAQRDAAWRVKTGRR